MEIPDAEPTEAEPGEGRRMAQPAGGPPQMPRQMQMMQQRFPGGPGAMQEQEPQTGNTREVTWLVAIEGNSPLKIVLTSQKGGTKVRELTVR
jgi:hypothetical protein